MALIAGAALRPLRRGISIRKDGVRSGRASRIEALWGTDLFRLRDHGSVDTIRSRTAIDPSRRAFQMAKEHGDPTFAALACRGLSIYSSCLGPPTRSSSSVRPSTHWNSCSRSDFSSTEFPRQLALVRMLRGRTTKFGSLDDGRVRGALLRGAYYRSSASRLPGMLLLDPKAPGALLRRRLCVGSRCSG